jgi:hypothetical protein
MPGEERNDPGAVPRPPAHVLAARIGEQLGDIGRARLARIDRLRAGLQSGDFHWDNTPLAQAVLAVHSAGRELQFAPLRPGWAARLLGKHRAAYDRFIAAHERITGCATQARAQAELAAARQRECMPAARRLVAELESELDSLDARVDEGVTWLQDMCTQLAQARAQGREEPQHASLAEAAQSHTQQFKRMQAVSTMAHDIAVRGNTILARRAAMVEHARADAELFERIWSPRLAPLVAALKDGRSPADHIPKAIEVHDDLMKRLAATVDACGALQLEEHLMDEHLTLLREEIERPREDAD